MYDALEFALCIVVIKFEFVIMIIKFISSLFSKDIIKIACNAVFLLLFDFLCILFFNRDHYVVIALLIHMYFITIIFDSNDIIAIFKPVKVVNNTVKNMSK